MTPLQITPTARQLIIQARQLTVQGSPITAVSCSQLTGQRRTLSGMPSPHCRQLIQACITHLACMLRRLRCLALLTALGHTTRRRITGSSLALSDTALQGGQALPVLSAQAGHITLVPMTSRAQHTISLAVHAVTVRLTTQRRQTSCCRRHSWHSRGITSRHTRLSG